MAKKKVDTEFEQRINKLPEHIKPLARKLRPKQLYFADNYIESSNATQSALDAGYSTKTARTIGSENLTKLDIKTYIDARLDLISSSKIATQKEVMEYLTRCMRGEEKDKIAAGAKVVEIPISNKDRLKSAELIGKRFAMFTDKVQNDVSGSVEIQGLQQLSADQLAKLADEKPDTKFDVNADYKDA